MSSRYARILAAGGAAVLAVTLAPAPALAATTWTIKPGGAITAMSGPVTVNDPKTGSFKCVSSTASGTLKRGSGLPGSRAGSLSAVSFLNCSNAGGQRFTLQPGGLPWHVNFSSYSAADGVVRGTISHIHIALSGSCSAMIDGTGATASNGIVRFRYTDSTGRLRMLATGGNLRFYGVSSGCLGDFHDGDPATLSATYTVTPKQAITSP